MKASELMVGDWVNLSKGNWSENRQVELIDIEMIAESVYLADPIPLTPEILEKNGFEKDPESGELIWTDDDVTEVVWVGTFLTIRGEYANAEFATWMFVHELQHALRLCGIEKEIEL